MSEIHTSNALDGSLNGYAERCKKAIAKAIRADREQIAQEIEAAKPCLCAGISVYGVTCLRCQFAAIARGNKE